MKEEKFKKENIKVWEEFESILKLIKSKGFKKSESNKIDRFLTLYNKICSHLSYSRTNFKNSPTTLYLNNLVATAHGYIYKTKSSGIAEIFNFLLKRYPILLVENSRFIITSFLIFLAGLLFSFLLIIVFPDNIYIFASEEFVEHILSLGELTGQGSSMSANIMTNNIAVSLYAFSYGVTLGIGTIYVLIVNAFMLGSAFAVAYLNDINLQFFSMILPHGVLELFSIFVAGGAGLLIGYSIINPGRLSRKDSIIKGSKTSLLLVMGTIPLFIIAGIIEGFISFFSKNVTLNLSIALADIIFLTFYIAVPNYHVKKKHI